MQWSSKWSAQITSRIGLTTSTIAGAKGVLCLGVVIFLALSRYQLHHFYAFFVSDVHQPLSQIRMSLAGSLGAGQITFLAGINATENTVRDISKSRRKEAKVRCKERYAGHHLTEKCVGYFTGCLYYSSSSRAVLSDGSFLLDARWGTLPLLPCCQSLQHQQQDVNLPCHVMG